MQSIVDEIIADLPNEIDRYTFRRQLLAEQVKARDKEVYEDLIKLFRAMGRFITQKCREEITTTFQSVILDLEFISTSMNIRLEQGAVKYASFEPINFDIALDGESMSVNGKRFPSNDLRGAFNHIVMVTTSAALPRRTMIEMDLSCDPL